MTFTTLFDLGELDAWQHLSMRAKDSNTIVKLLERGLGSRG